MRKLTREEFILKARQLHGWKYDYSKVEYVNTRTKVCIICPIHGEFWQAPSKHLSGRGCHQCIIEENKSKPKCRNKRLTTDIFVQRARLIHVGKYDYSKAKYVNRATKVCIVCPAHGEFWQAPCNHLSGNGCPICAKESTKERISSNTQDFIAKSHNKHGDKYDYSKVEYKGSDKKVCIICPDHGEFWQTPESHLQGKGCPICAHKKTSQRKTKDHSLVLSQFIKKHGLIFDYSKMEYKGMMTKITIICPNGHEFSMTPKHHLKGGGCPYCAGFDRTTEQFIEESRGVHGDKYIYTATKYTKATDKVCIECPKHGVFWQGARVHLEGSGCPACGKESLGERKIAKWLNDNFINFERQYTITPQQVLFGRNRFRIDFYIPSYNTFIEFNGEQHYRRVKSWHTDEEFAEQQDRDRRLREYCKQHKIRLIEIPYTEIDNIDKILTRKFPKTNKN